MMLRQFAETVSVLPPEDWHLKESNVPDLVLTWYTGSTGDLARTSFHHVHCCLPGARPNKAPWVGTKVLRCQTSMEQALVPWMVVHVSQVRQVGKQQVPELTQSGVGGNEATLQAAEGQHPVSAEEQLQQVGSLFSPLSGGL